jgi:hypothetical protein
MLPFGPGGFERPPSPQPLSPRVLCHRWRQPCGMAAARSLAGGKDARSPRLPTWSRSRPHASAAPGCRQDRLGPSSRCHSSRHLDEGRVEVQRPALHRQARGSPAACVPSPPKAPAPSRDRATRPRGRSDRQAAARRSVAGTRARCGRRPRSGPCPHSPASRRPGPPSESHRVGAVLEAPCAVLVNGTGDDHLEGPGKDGKWRQPRQLRSQLVCTVSPVIGHSAWRAQRSIRTSVQAWSSSRLSQRHRRGFGRARDNRTVVSTDALRLGLARLAGVDVEAHRARVDSIVG